jgi:hypothetical protein
VNAALIDLIAGPVGVASQNNTAQSADVMAVSKLMSSLYATPKPLSLSPAQPTLPDREGWLQPLLIRQSRDTRHP